VGGIADLLDAVAEPEGRPAVVVLRLVERGWVEALLESQVEVGHAGDVLLARAQHLDVLRAGVEVLGHEIADQVHHALGDVFGDRDGAVPERLGVVVREFAVQDAVGVHHDRGAGVVLTEDLGEPGARDVLDIEQVAQDAAGADARQLVDVADQEELAAV
jgi:hypothetical protein